MKQDEFRLINSEVKTLTPELAQEFRDMEPSPTERDLNPGRVRHLKEKAEKGWLVTFHWGVARMGDRRMRMNGQHSSAMLSSLNGSFPDGLKVHLDEYEVGGFPGLANLFRQFDDRKSGRSTGDVAGAYQGLIPELKNVPKPTAKLGAEGICWYLRTVEAAEATSGDGQYTLFNNSMYHPFLQWLGELFTIKTPELKRAQIVSAMYATFLANQEAAKTFWTTVARGGVEFEDDAPETTLDNWLKDAREKKARQQLKPGHYYQGCIYAWNAHREEKTLKAIKYDTQKGFSEAIS
jgi:hypothetical protein